MEFTVVGAIFFLQNNTAKEKKVQYYICKTVGKMKYLLKKEKNERKKKQCLLVTKSKELT